MNHAYGSLWPSRSENQVKQYGKLGRAPKTFFCEESGDKRYVSPSRENLASKERPPPSRVQRPDAKIRNAQRCDKTGGKKIRLSICVCYLSKTLRSSFELKLRLFFNANNWSVTPVLICFCFLTRTLLRKWRAWRKRKFQSIAQLPPFSGSTSRWVQDDQWSDKTGSV